MIRFLVDNQLPDSLARWIETQGCACEHVLASNLGQSPDTAIWEHAANTEAVIISKDEDFAHLTLTQPSDQAFRNSSSKSPAVIWMGEIRWVFAAWG